jgi:ABC-type lipoprotein export system ATPase subunit
MIIEARNVEKSFGQTPALRGATVDAKRGEILAIMGPSGSGKSTLLHTVILVTHEPRVAAYADREVIVRDGKVAALTGVAQ